MSLPTAEEIGGDTATIWLPPYDPDAPVDRSNQIAQLASICVLNSLTRECCLSLSPVSLACHQALLTRLSSHHHCRKNLVSWDEVEAVPCR
jgi:hypothetical protein